jgi:hypothetical protein
VILDSGFASFKCIRGMAENGMYAIGNVKSAHVAFPKAWLKQNAPVRGERSCASTSFKTSSGETWSVLGACDKDKQPMALIGTAGTTRMGTTLQRHFTVIRSDGSWDVRSASLEQWDIHATYRRYFNAIDKHNSKRQGPASFEDTWKTHKWWLREFQMLVGMSEVNAYLLWKRFKPGQNDCDASLFRRRLAFQLLHHPVRLIEREESLAMTRSRRLGIAGAPEHYLVQNPKGGKNRLKRLHCRYCDKKSAYSCACSPWVGGDMNPRDAMVVCSDRQGGRCMLRHRAGEKPVQKRSKAAGDGWRSQTPNANKTDENGAVGSSRGPRSG